ncbi:HAD family hydrolase [Cyanobium sp. Morenito 9A2]|uniref:HAD-IIIC family phosphatase n=1 Tax=Cyanobium sp. Morenito 9A2 TaxID=2823718 RepID=UPI0020CFAEBE|nr:HAD-IIIC family phosphatase [Cyanobium sp. Morenito 9A2]MCP9851255.1 HAD family hydrolase [Cyanobium sp. Morenito 9A2]
MKSALKTHLRAGAHDEALSLLLRAAPSDPIDDLQYAGTALDKIPRELLDARVPLRKRVAVLGGATTQFFVPLLRLFALRRGLNLEIYESDFGLFEQEIWSDSETLRAFKPDVIHFHVCSQNLPFAYLEDDAAARAEAESARFRTLYATAAERFACQVLADNFATEVDRPYGSLDAVLGGTRNSLLRAVNLELARHLPPQVFLHDVDMLSAAHGKARWSDARLYHSAKCAISFDCQPHYADHLAAALAAMFGKSKKCLVLDLDNTLWGGVIGDDGLGGIQLGAGVPAGEAFVAFQRYAKALKDRGVLLAVASKNHHENAVQPFREHPDMVLKESDISCFVANWEPKDGNIKAIARQLNIGTDALVFFDDNPAERELVRTRLPEVTVPEVPVDPSYYVQCLVDGHWFDTLGVTAEDRQRSDFFQGNVARESLEKSAANYDDYLRQLDMTAIVEPVTEQNLARTTQLINKTNQFNLTTRRMTEAEVRAHAADPLRYTSTTRLTDKFGDNGLISVVLGSVPADSPDLLDIEVWLMSCRVLKRGVEVLDLEQLLAFCRRQGLKRLRGRYLPTAKNQLVEGHYATLGFRQIESGGEGSTWIYDVDEPFGLSHSIQIRN